MEKIISINLAGQILPIEETAYNDLTTYFESLRGYFRTQAGGDEILSDIESRVAELFVEKLRLGAPAVNAAHVAAVRLQLGSVEDFREASGDAPGPEPQQENNAFATPEGRRRFFRDPNDKVLGGVCSGLAGYFNVDPALIRIIFGVLALAGWGTGILLYLALWFMVPQSAENTYRGRRLYRSAEDRWIGGICGGLATYFSKDPWLFRLAFGLPLLFGTGFLHGFSFVFGSLSGAAVLIYILLWIVLPVAKTDFQKMELRGEKIDIHTIRDNVYSDLKNRSRHFAQEARDAADRLGSEAGKIYQQHGRPFVSDAGQAFSRGARTGASTLGRLIRGLLLFIAAAVAFGLFALLMGYFFGDFSRMANLYLFETPRQKTLAFLSVILLLGMPLLSVLTIILRSTLRLPSGFRHLRAAFGILWIGGFVALAGLLSSLNKSLRHEQTARQTVPLQTDASGTLLVRAIGTPIRYRNTLAGIRGSFKGLDLDDDSLRSAWISFRVVPATDSQYRVVVARSSFGRTGAEALRRAKNIYYPLMENLQAPGALTLPAGFVIAQPDYYRGQQVTVEVQVPVGGKVRFDPSVKNTLLDDYYAETSFGRTGKRWQYRRRWFNTPESNVIYVMGADGALHRADGREEADPFLDETTDFGPAPHEDEDDAEQHII